MIAWLHSYVSCLHSQQKLLGLFTWMVNIWSTTLTQCILGVTLELTRSGLDLSRSAVKLKSRNNLITKLAGTSWGAGASTLRTSALAPCYSVAEYCCPVWARSSYTNLIDTQLHSNVSEQTGIFGFLCSIYLEGEFLFRDNLPSRRYDSSGTGPCLSVCLVVCPFVCLSVSICVCHKSVFYRNGWTNRTGFGMGASFHLSYTVLNRKSGISKN